MQLVFDLFCVLPPADNTDHSTEAVDDASEEDGDVRVALVAREVLPDNCTAKRIVASSAKLARRWLYEEASLPDTPEGRRERAHAVCMIAAEIVDAMWFAQGVNRYVARGALYSPAVRTLTLYNKLVGTDPHLWDEANNEANNDAYEHLTWYTCPRGHPYTVGNCGRPMALSICSAPGCGETIGGEHHTSAAGNTELDVKSVKALNKTGSVLKRGYNFEATADYYVNRR